MGSAVARAPATFAAAPIGFVYLTLSKELILRSVLWSTQKEETEL